MNNQRSELAVILPDEWQVLTQQASALVGSGFLPQSIKNVQQAVAIMTLGRELGVGAWAALSSINVIQQKPTISPQLMLALINRSGQLEDMKVQDEGGTVHVMMKRRARTEHWETFGQADAEKMNLWNKPNWKSQPATMMKWRAVAACARVVFPDVILGLYTPEEMGANVVADDQGNMTIVEVRRDEPPPRQSAPQLPEGEIVEESQPSASVSGAGLPKPEAEADPLAWTEDPPNLYRCSALIVNQTKTARQYILKVQQSQVRIPLHDYAYLPDLKIGDMSVLELNPGEHPLTPPWAVFADSSPTGWAISAIGQLEAI